MGGLLDAGGLGGLSRGWSLLCSLLVFSLLGLLGLALTASLGRPLRADLLGLFCGSSSSEDDEDELNCSEDDSLLVSLRDLRFFLAVRLLRWLGGVESLLDERVVRTLRPRASDWLLSLRATTRRCLSPLVSGFLCRSSSSSRCRFLPSM